MAVDASRLEQGLRQQAMIWLDRADQQFVDRARVRCSRRTGALADSIEATPATDEGTRITAEIHVGEDYGRWQDEGTGIYGPDGGRIYPLKPGGVLAFDWPAAGGMVFFRSVAGSPGTRFWSDTVDDWPSIVASL